MMPREDPAKDLRAALTRTAAWSAAWFACSGVAAACCVIFLAGAPGTGPDAAAWISPGDIHRDDASPVVGTCGRGGCGAVGLSLDLAADSLGEAAPPLALDAGLARPAAAGAGPRKAGVAFVQHAAAFRGSGALLALAAAGRAASAGPDVVLAEEAATTRAPPVQLSGDAALQRVSDAVGEVVVSDALGHGSWAEVRPAGGGRAAPGNLSLGVHCASLLAPGERPATAVPLTAAGRLELELFGRFGLAPSLHSCQGREDAPFSAGNHMASFVQRASSAVVARAPLKGRDAAFCVAASWAAVVAAVIVWSLLGALTPPAKVDDDEDDVEKRAAPREEPQLADEAAAWKRGFLYWIGLGWVDSLMARYGKCPSACVHDAELVREAADADYEPFVRLRRAWDEQIQRAGGVQGASLVWALQKVIGMRACMLLVIAVVVEVFMSMIGMVLALDLLLHYLQRAREASEQEAHADLLVATTMVILLAFCVPLLHRAASTVVTLMDGYYTNVCAAGLASLVYEKALLLPAGAGGGLGGAAGSPTASGLAAAPHGGPGAGASGAPSAAIGGDGRGALPNAVQLLNVDIIEASGYLLRILANALVAPFAALGLLVLLVAKLRLAGFFGALYVFPVLAVTWFVQMMGINSWRQYQGHQDTRLGRLSDTILQIRAIKALAWERLFFQRVTEAREAELSANFACALASGCTQANLHSIPWFSLAITLVLVCAFRGAVEAWQVFVVHRVMMSFFSLLHFIVWGLHKAMMVPNSIARIKAFLAQPERPRSSPAEPVMDRQAPAAAARVSGSFAFDPSGEAVLKDIHLTIPRGELVAVVGAVGSGKSALLLAFLGELAPKAPRSGVAAVTGKVAYCAQTPWIFEGTLRENITLSRAFDQERYERAVRAALLDEDLPLLPGGDLVALGASGQRLSAGQRARVALARAAYMEGADLVLLDDPFSALDAATAQRLLDGFLLGGALRGRARVAALSGAFFAAAGGEGVRRLRRFGRVVLLEEGRVAADGTPEEVVASAAFARLARPGVGTTNGSSGGATSALACATAAAAEEPLDMQLPAAPPQTPPPAAGASPGGGDLSALRGLAGGAPHREDQDSCERFNWSTMQMWLRAAGRWNLFAFCLVILVQRGLFLLESLVLASWVDAKLAGQPVGDRRYISTLVVVVSITCLSFIALYWALGRLSFSASRRIHEHMLAALLRAPVDRFFDKEPVGALLSRFSLDLRFADNHAISNCILTLATFAFGFLVSQLYVLAVAPWRVALCAAPIYGAMFFYAYLYRGTAVPLIVHSKSSLGCIQDLQGMVTSSCVSIRANGMRADFMARHNRHSATIIRCQYLVFHVAEAWLQSRVTMCFCSLTAAFAIGGLWSGMPVGTLANVLSLSFMLMSEFDATARIFPNFISCLNSVRRLSRVLDAPQEAPSAYPGDPQLRLSLSIEREHLAALEVRGGVQAEASLPDCANPTTTWLYFDGRGGQRTSAAVFLKGKFALLRASEDGLSLEMLDGRRLRDLAPGCEELRRVEESYNIVSVNGISRDAGQMAAELCNPPARLWVDLWSTRYAPGLAVRIQDLHAGYCGEPSALRGLSLDVPARGRVALIGRAGAGKSTTLLCLLRMLEPRSGRILIGDWDISRIGLSTLRAICGIVPQEPMVFEGTLRENLDALGERPDGVLWDALQSTTLLPFARKLPRGLDTPLASATRPGAQPGAAAEGGAGGGSLAEPAAFQGAATLSAAQRQLLGLARMVVRQPPLLLLDEYASAADARAGAAARACVASMFPMSTIIAAAHRVETLRGFGAVAVLEGGTVAKYGAVEEVLTPGARAPG